jgi:hypothetical protein
MITDMRKSLLIQIYEMTTSGEPEAILYISPPPPQEKCKVSPSPSQQI